MGCETLILKIATLKVISWNWWLIISVLLREGYTHKIWIPFDLIELNASNLTQNDTPSKNLGSNCGLTIVSLLHINNTVIILK